MRREWLLVAVGVLVLCVVGIMPALAQGPGENPIYATIEYVDQRISELTGYVDQKVAELYIYVDEKIAEVGGGGPDFDLPEDWTIHLYKPERRLEFYGPLPGCSWNGLEIRADWHSPVQVRAVAWHGDQVLGYAVGTCRNIEFGELSYIPQPNETIDVEFWFFWMGTEKSTTIPVTVPPNSAPLCQGGGISGTGVPLQRRFTAHAVDPDGDELSYFWDFGDGTTLWGAEEQVHTYGGAGTYCVIWKATDGELECQYPLHCIEVE